MPFDGSGYRARRPAKDKDGAQSALVLDMVEFFFRGGARWTKGTFQRTDGSRCMLGAVRFVRQQLGSTNDRAPEYLARAIGKDPGFWTQTWAAVIQFNDARDRTYPEIAEAIRKAKALAEADIICGEGEKLCRGKPTNTSSRRRSRLPSVMS